MGAAEQSIHDLLSIIRRHERWRTGDCLNLLASENVTSPAVRAALASDFGHRYTAPDGFYRGTRFTDEIEAAAAELAQRVFRAKFADVRPLSGHSCNMTVVMTYARGKMVSVDPANGGYPGVSHLGLGKLLGLRNLYFPYANAAMNLDVDGATRLLADERPPLTLFGSSFLPFPHPTRALSIDSHGSTVVYDGSHVLGLMAGACFQDPLREGCDLLIGSTHKSLFGPQGGVILTNDRVLAEQVAGSLFPGLVDNSHWNRIAGLAIALAEMRRFGSRYAEQVRRNAKVLARVLHDAHIPVKGAGQGFTESHQVIIDYGNPGLNHRRATALEDANIICDAGIRLGTSEVTRRGMREAEMERIGELIRAVWVRAQPAKLVAREVRGLAGRFQTLAFTLKG